MSRIPDFPEWPCHAVAVPIDIGGVRGTTRNVGVENVVFASPASFAVGSPISFVLTTPDEAAFLRFACNGTVTQNQAIDSGGFETAATIDSIHLVRFQGTTP